MGSRESCCKFQVKKSGTFAVALRLSREEARPPHALGLACLYRLHGHSASSSDPGMQQNSHSTSSSLIPNLQTQAAMMMIMMMMMMIMTTTRIYSQVELSLRFGSGNMTGSPLLRVMMTTGNKPTSAPDPNRQYYNFGPEKLSCLDVVKASRAPNATSPILRLLWSSSAAQEAQKLPDPMCRVRQADPQQLCAPAALKNP